LQPPDCYSFPCKFALQQSNVRKRSKFGGRFGAQRQSKKYRLYLSAGRAALQKALIACSLFADDYFNVRYQMECERTSKAFVVEFSDDASTLAYLFRGVITLTKVQHTQVELDAQQGRRGQDQDSQMRKVFTDILQKAYHDVNLSQSNVVAPSSQSGSNISNREAAPLSTTMLIPLRMEGGVYVVPVLINNAITLNFTVHSGAADVSIPADVFMTLVRAGTIQETDLLGTKSYTLADGSSRSARTFRLRSLTLGGKVVEDVLGSVAPVEGPLLLGQTFLERFKSWSIDNVTHSLVLIQSSASNAPLVNKAQPTGTEPAAQTSSPLSPLLPLRR
jgi:predicted aspartyl protease